jgi:hypothetical protein
MVTFVAFIASTLVLNHIIDEAQRWVRFDDGTRTMAKL